MSKFRYRAMRSRSAWLNPVTYAVEPIRPDSSAPHHAKRSVFCGFSLAMFSAISSRAAEPLPLSLMPGPAWTESRWAPAITTLSLLVPGSSAITFTCGRSSGGSTTMNAVEPACASAAPSANEAPTTGIVTRCAAGNERADDQPFPRWRVALVEDDHGLGPCRLGVDRLDRERAGPALDQGDVAPTAEVSAEVGGLATARHGARGRTRLMSTGITLPSTTPNPLPVKAPVS